MLLWYAPFEEHAGPRDGGLEALEALALEHCLRTMVGTTGERIISKLVASK